MRKIRDLKKYEFCFGFFLDVRLFSVWQDIFSTIFFHHEIDLLSSINFLLNIYNSISLTCKI